MNITDDQIDPRAGAAGRRSPLGRRLGRRIASLAAVLLVGAGVTVPAGMAAAHGDVGVLPPWAMPYGYSLTDMTRLAAQFTTSGNDPAYYPRTPFQILFTDANHTTAEAQTAGGGSCEDNPTLPCGLLVTQPAGEVANSFTVRRATPFFVPILNADDSAPVVGVYPKTAAGAKVYVFDPNQLGGRGFSVCIDDGCAALGPLYVAGPVKTPPLLDGNPPGTHMITIGAFLGDMRPGVHVVRIRGGYYGAAIAAAYDGLAFLAVDFSYQVRVTR